MTRLLLLLALALLAAACAAQDDGLAVGQEGTEPPATAGPSGGTQPAAPTEQEASDRPAGDDELPNPVTGTLDRLDVEGGCTVLVVDGRTYELVAASGASVAIDPANGVVATTAGEVIAEVGDTITVTGQVDPGMMSFCQVGPILTAEDITAD